MDNKTIQTIELHLENIMNCAKLKNVLVIYTGGTIGMRKNEKNVYTTCPQAFKKKVRICDELHSKELAILYGCNKEDTFITKSRYSTDVITYKIIEPISIVDSCNLSISDWVTIGNKIKETYEDFDGFVILQGTDTMAYTASVLSFMISKLNKPVILTGAQVPIFETPTDGIYNFFHSLYLASCSNIPEVCVFFSNKLMRGNRVEKVNASDYDAFNSPNYPPLAEIGMDVQIYSLNILPRPKEEKISIFNDLCPRVGIVQIFPTLSQTQLQSSLEPPLEAVVLLTYGAGNMPSNRPDLMEVLQRAVRRGMLIVNVTQCYKGCVDLLYETGRYMREIGVIGCNDITVEAAYAKLLVVCGKEKQLNARIRLMETSLRGEMTTDDRKVYHQK